MLSRQLTAGAGEQQRVYPCLSTSATNLNVLLWLCLAVALHFIVVARINPPAKCLTQSRYVCVGSDEIIVAFGELLCDEMNRLDTRIYTTQDSRHLALEDKKSGEGIVEAIIRATVCTLRRYSR